MFWSCKTQSNTMTHPVAFYAVFGCMSSWTFWRPLCWAGASIFYILYSTLILPSSGEGRGCWGCCCCWLLWERTRSVILLQRNTGSIYSNNLVRTDHVCSCLVTSAAQEWIDQSCDDCYPVYRFATYQRDTGWSYHRLPLVTGIHFTRCRGLMGLDSFMGSS